MHRPNARSHGPGLTRVALVLALLPLVQSCSSPPTKQEQQPPAAASPQLWGDMKPVVSVKELMRDMIDPISDNIFEAVGDEWSKNGIIDHRPQTDEDWDGFGLARSRWLKARIC